ncbi:low molecular weight phosphotyrosine protein phosphatase [Isoptericola sp. NEAU-Y5]|uniref:protein-tyrosine-phosphatase n=1 Tax=Isoptericola luteus TaxID=2879484 RepID=A0ABS7ZGD3_9MICO|nr:low molecular weight protein-tyrosine-phosphatase [Isoptericola sp. NEAU-Y5]MCA5894091.1 low molecular weight phosphotyrosine protein phosphatase [Isoptericola sp. NEAU-Y5]
MTNPYRVMTVCTGNICRSPMAEIVLRDRLEAAGLGGDVVVDSTGVSDEEQGNGIDARARRVLVEHGYAAGDGHRARQVTRDGLAEADLVLVMTAQHARRLRRLAAGSDGAAAAGRPEIRLFRSFDPAAPLVARDTDEHLLDVDDPWYGDQDGFTTTLDEIEAAAHGVVEHVRTRLAARAGDPA